MEIIDYLKIIRRHLTIFISIVVLSTALAFILTKNQPTSYTAATTFTASKSAKINPVEIYDPANKICSGLQLSNRFSEIVTAWFNSPSIVSEIYQQADLKVPNITQDNLAKTFKVFYTPQGVISVTTSGHNPEDLFKLLNNAGIILQNKTTQLSDRDSYNYQLTEETPVVTQDKSKLGLNTFVGLFSGLILAILTVMMVEYFKKKQLK